MILLTGGTGFIGYYIAHLLAARGLRFRALVRPASDTTYLQELSDWCTMVEGDVLDPESLVDALQGVDTVVHAAALVSYSAEDETAMQRTNAGGTANVVDMMLEVGTPRLIYLSSVAALHRRDGGPPTRLSDNWPTEEPPTPYARSKFAAEREVWRGQAEGLSVAALYPAVTLGAGNWNGHGTPRLWKRAVAGGSVFPRGSNGFVDVRDVATATLDVIERQRDGERLLLSAANLSWYEVLSQIAASVDTAPPRLGLSRWQSSLLWPLTVAGGRLTGRQALITRASHHNLQARFAYDGSTYPATTGRSYIPIATTIAETGKAFHLSQQMNPDALPPTFLPLMDLTTTD